MCDLGELTLLTDNSFIFPPGLGIQTVIHTLPVCAFYCHSRKSGIEILIGFLIFGDGADVMLAVHPFFI